MVIEHRDHSCLDRVVRDEGGLSIGSLPGRVVALENQRKAEAALESWPKRLAPGESPDSNHAVATNEANRAQYGCGEIG